MVNFLFVWNLLQWRPDCELLSILHSVSIIKPFITYFFLHYHFVYFINSAVQFYSEKLLLQHFSGRFFIFIIYFISFLPPGIARCDRAGTWTLRPPAISPFMVTMPGASLLGRGRRCVGTPMPYPS